MNKGIVGLMAGACVLLGGAVVYLQMKTDREPPTISFQENGVIYTKEGSYEQLLDGVTAVDDCDGDVTDSLEIENVYVEENDGKATVVYVARDKSNNIAKAKRKIGYQESRAAVIASVSDEAGEEKDGKDNVQSGSDQTVTQTEEGENQQDDNEQDDNEQDDNGQDEELPKENPRIKLKTEQITIHSGESVNRISYVESVTDDKDDTNKLWRNISIDGDEFNSSVPGVYKQIFYVVDSDGNKSNEATLTITVE